MICIVQFGPTIKGPQDYARSCGLALKLAQELVQRMVKDSLHIPKDARNPRSKLLQVSIAFRTTH